MYPRFLPRAISFFTDASLRSISGASPPSCLSSVSTAMFAFAIETPFKPRLPSAVALDQGGKLPLRLGAGRPQPLLLLERGLVSHLLQPGGRCFQRRIQPRLSCQRVDDQNEIATSAFRIGIS